MRRRMTRFGLAVSVAAVVLSLTAGAAFAGEVTGSGKNIDQNQGRSWCSFSGLNDKLEGEGPTGPQAQSYGQDVKLGLFDPSTLKGQFPSPGTACNPQDPNNFGGGNPPPRK